MEDEYEKESEETEEKAEQQDSRAPRDNNWWQREGLEISITCRNAPGRVTLR